MKKYISFFVALSLIACFTFETSAQTNRQKPRVKRGGSTYKKQKNKAGQTQIAALTKKELSVKVKAAPSPEVAPDAPPAPVLTPINNSPDAVTLPKPVEKEFSSDVLSGSVVVNVSENTNAAFKIGLSPRGVAVIDFPSADPIYRIHPADEDFVTVGCFSRDEGGKCGNTPTDAVILRPGKNFHALGSEESAATVITIQRVSGMVFSLIVVPVKNVSDNTNYLAVRYDTRTAVEARLKAGLAANLIPGAMAQKSFDSPNQNGEVVKTKSTVESVAGADNNTPSADDSEIEALVTAEMQKVADNESGLKFSKPVHGLSLARTSAVTRTGDTTIEVVAVRNTLPQAIRLIPDQPLLVVENRDKKQTGINIQEITKSYLVTTAPAEDVLIPGQIYYYAFAYPSPILGVKQVLRVLFAQREAADAPASLELSGLAR